jgi:hypothetical protein
VYASGRHPKAPEWTYVTAFLPGEIVRGYVQGPRVNFDLPEPLAELRQLVGGETAEQLAKEKFGGAVRDGHDLRFYENVLLYVNTGRDGITGTYQDPGLLGRGASNIKLVKNHRIWLVSAEFAKSLEGVVPSGSFTGGAVAKARRFAQHLEDILESIAESRHHFAEVAGEHAQAIRDHIEAIIGVTAAFLVAEAGSMFLAAAPTGVSQAAAAIIQLALAAFGAAGMVQASIEGLKHASAWLTTAWTAKGRPEAIAEASKEFIRMLVAIAMAALAYVGAKGNYGNALKIASKMPRSAAPALATVGGNVGGGGQAATATAIGPGAGGLGVVGAQMVKHEGEGGTSSEAKDASKANDGKPKGENAPAPEVQPPAVLKKPAPRHTLKKVTQGSVAKDLNTVIEPRVNVADDVQAVAEGKAVPGRTADGIPTYTVNGRTYGVEASGTLFPMSGDGFILLNRNAYKVLGIFNKFGNTPRALEIIELQRPTSRFTDADIESALHAWRAGQGG